MTYQRIMGIQVTDDNEYQRYREAMEPILNSIGGTFGYDFKIAETLRTQTPEPINRVFTIEFPSQQAMDDFFRRDDYLAIKKQHFESSVGAVTAIAMGELGDT